MFINKINSALHIFFKTKEKMFNSMQWLYVQKKNKKTKKVQTTKHVEFFLFYFEVPDFSLASSSSSS